MKKSFYVLKRCIVDELSSCGQNDQEECGLFPIKKDGKWGYMDKTGKIVINPQFDNAEDFSEGLAAIKIGHKYGYIDKTGKVVINPHFKEAFDFSEGLACVRIRGIFIGKYGYIDKTGKMVIEPQFYWARKFSEGLAGVKIGNKWGYIDKTGEIVIEPQFDETGDFSKGLAYVEFRYTGYKKVGHIDKKGNYIYDKKVLIAEEPIDLYINRERL